MAGGKDPQWTGIYETPSPSDADLVRTTLEVAGYRVWGQGGTAPGIFGPTSATSGRATLEVAGSRVWVQGGNAPGIFGPSNDTSGALTVSVPAEDAEDARDYLSQKTSLLPHDAAAPSDDETAPPQESLADIAQEILELRHQHEVAACKYCGIATLDLGEIELDSRMIALLRASGLGVNSATFSEFEPGERICTDC